MHMYKISVIIPVYNAEKTLPDTLKNTAAQSLSDIEIICVDDGSTDQSFKIIKNWQAVHSNIRCVRQQNGGAGSARNRGMDMAAGEYIAFMDADDSYPNEHALETLYQAAESQGAFICGGSAVYDHPQPEDMKCVFSQEKLIKFSDYQYDTLFGRFPIPGADRSQNILRRPGSCLLLSWYASGTENDPGKSRRLSDGPSNGTAFIF